jgi:hypothetical protein
LVVPLSLARDVTPPDLARVVMKMKRSIAAIVLTALAAAASASASTERKKVAGPQCAKSLQATAAVNATVPTIGAVPVATAAGEPCQGE